MRASRVRKLRKQFKSIFNRPPYGPRYYMGILTEPSEWRRWKMHYKRNRRNWKGALNVVKQSLMEGQK